MAPGINHLGPHTTQQDIDAIKQHFGNNYEAIDQALLTGVTGNFKVEDLLVARYELSGELPAFMVAAQGDIPTPDEAPWLWEEKEIDTYRYWQNNEVKLREAMDKLLAQAPIEYADIIESADHLEDIPGAGGSNPSNEAGSLVKQNKNTGENGLDFSKDQDLHDFMAAQMKQGNMSGALSAYAVYSFGPSAMDATDEVLYKYEEGNERLDELVDELAGLDPESPDYQAESQRIQMQINRIQETSRTLLNFIQQLHDMKLEILEMASSLERRSAQTISTIIGNF